MRIFAAVGLVVGALLAGSPARAAARARVAIAEFQIDGGDSPALALQLQDGFVLGLVRAGVQVLDAVDTGRRLDGHPELQHCDASPCLKAIGQLLDVRYVVRVKVDVAGNSYKSVARLFSTEGAAPAALPVATRSKSCDVCTVAEAREIMLRLADTLRAYVEETAAPAPVAPPPPPPPPRLAAPVIAAMAGALAIAAGFGVLASNGSCTQSACSENRSRSALGGALIGGGAAVMAVGTYVTIVRSRGNDPVTGVVFAARF